MTEECVYTLFYILHARTHAHTHTHTTHTHTTHNTHTRHARTHTHTTHTHTHTLFCLISVTIFNFPHPPILSAHLLILSACRFLVPDSPLFFPAPFLSFGPHAWVAFPFLFVRNSLWTPSSQTLRHFFSKNVDLFSVPCCCLDPQNIDLSIPCCCLDPQNIDLSIPCCCLQPQVTLFAAHFQVAYKLSFV